MAGQIKGFLTSIDSRQSPPLIMIGHQELHKVNKSGDLDNYFWYFEEQAMVGLVPALSTDTASFQGMSNLQM